MEKKKLEIAIIISKWMQFIITKTKDLISQSQTMEKIVFNEKKNVLNQSTTNIEMPLKTKEPQINVLLDIFNSHSKTGPHYIEDYVSHINHINNDDFSLAKRKNLSLDGAIIFEQVYQRFEKNITLREEYYELMASLKEKRVFAENVKIIAKRYREVFLNTITLRKMSGYKNNNKILEYYNTMLSSDSFEKIMDAYLNFLKCAFVMPQGTIEQNGILLEISLEFIFKLSVLTCFFEVPKYTEISQHLIKTFSNILAVLADDKKIPKNLKKVVTANTYFSEIDEVNYSELIGNLIDEYNDFFNADKLKNNNSCKYSLNDNSRKLSRSERIKLYEESKTLKTEQYFLDDQIELSSLQINKIIDFVNLSKDMTDKDDIKELLALLPKDYFDDQSIMLKEIIERLKKHNINHITNKLLIILNDMFKENSATKKCKK